MPLQRKALSPRMTPQLPPSIKYDHPTPYVNPAGNIPRNPETWGIAGAGPIPGSSGPGTCTGGGGERGHHAPVGDSHQVGDVGDGDPPPESACSPSICKLSMIGGLQQREG
jgi:hypothetical protein